MILNIIDRRKRPYRFAKINAVIEPTRHDNSTKDCDLAPANLEQGGAWLGYAEREHIGLVDAIGWAVSHPDAVTLYLYDEDSGIYPSSRALSQQQGGK